MERQKTIGYRAQQYWNISKGGAELPEFQALFAEFTERAQQEEQPDWFVKYAGLYFTFRGKYYGIGPGALNTSGEIFECLVDELIDRMYALGAYDMFYSGMLD